MLAGNSLVRVSGETVTYEAVFELDSAGKFVPKPINMLPATDQIRHFGNGQTEATVELKPGKHTLQLVLGDWKHQPHNPPVVSETITVTVK